LLGGGATTFFLMSGSDKKEEKAKINLPPPPGPMTTFIFPKILADLKTGLCKGNYLSMRFMVEVGTNYTKSIQKHQPKLLETIMLQLRSLERKSLIGKVGADQLRADITTIINNKIKPGKIESVIFKEFILQ
jgi:flagellar basal body-associated protein FliL